MRRYLVSTRGTAFGVIEKSRAIALHCIGLASQERAISTRIERRRPQPQTSQPFRQTQLNPLRYMKRPVTPRATGLIVLVWLIPLNLCLACDLQHPAARKVGEQQPGMRIGGQVPERVEHPVPRVVRDTQRIRI